MFRWIDEAMQAINGQGIELDCTLNGEHNGRRVRISRQSGEIQVSDDNFDRWANSLELSFDGKSAEGRRAFARWASGEMSPRQVDHYRAQF